ncbi:MAG: universal stress protein [Rubrobacter sp.]|nr:universal stress protein [Rubrobacter sp.]
MQTAVQLSKGLDLALHVINVAPVQSAYAAQGTLNILDLVDPELEGRLRERAEHRARETLDEQVQKIKDTGGKVAETHPKVGRPDVEIVRLAEELEAGLIIVGSRGSGPFKRDALGSVSESVVRHAPCPVLVVRADEATPAYKGEKLPP